MDIKKGYVNGVDVNEFESLESEENYQETLTQDYDWLILEPYFDREYYVSTYSDIDPQYVDPLEHYYHYGWKEGRNPSPVFDTSQYLENHPDVQEAGIHPLVHYVLFGETEGRAIFQVKDDIQESIMEDDPSDASSNLPSDLFETISRHIDNDYYYRNYDDIRNNSIDPVEHYALFGWKEGRNPSSVFNTKKYIIDNDLIKLDVNPLYHYIKNKDDVDLKVSPSRDKDSLGRIVLGKHSQSSLITHSGINTFYPSEAFSPTDSFNKEKMNIHWVIPDFSKGSGGHMTIFRFIRWFELFGHECTIWIVDPQVHKDENSAYEDLIKHFQTIKASVRFVTRNCYPEVGDAVIATGWQTVNVVEHLQGFKEKFYFVQDFEPYFYARGAQSILAEATYQKGLNCICASPWLKQKMESYGLWAREFMLAYDHSIYYPQLVSNDTDGKIKIAVYSRHFTERRAVELAYAGLELLASRRDDFEVHLYGSDISQELAPFDCIVHGVLSAPELADLYNYCDIGVCFSATNYSLVPQEMMACGLPLVELDVESTRAIYPEKAVTFALPSAAGICNAINELMDDPGKRKEQAQTAMQWVERFSWEDSAQRAEKAIIEKLSEKWSCKVVPPSNDIKASVIIPVYNGGDLLFDVLDKVCAQRAPWNFEVIVIDSSSKDGSPDRLAKDERITFVSIDQSEFGHGKTRNYGVEISKGEYIAFLTQDAIPYDEYWLYNLVAMLDHYPDAAGVFGKHIAHDDANEFTKLELKNHFDNFEQQPLYVSRHLDETRFDTDVGWRQFLHFYSDNSSCLRRSLWNEIPYRDVKYGEDQIWASDIIQSGYAKLYCPSSVIKHSHDYDEKQTFDRSKIDGDYFNFFWGYRVVPETEEECEQLIVNLSDQLKDFAQKNNISDVALIDQQLKNIQAKISGLYVGMKVKLSLFSDQSLEKSKF
ncbi:glycosyltransferase [Cobetia sp. cqz5-12]|uniref:rhamnosyltransferase WsaF family glycosyltransferase n=1 Tax=Cobetia sp. cqz5-12 TaxID=2609415 RepID=UPI00190638D8|nr:glycosyltransferase [Cobetia sp. cqz5-12]QQK64590.1 glycosyltransferase [Cobetia sp. cqz5-12]